MTVTVEQAQNALKDLIDRTARGRPSAAEVRVRQGILTIVAEHEEHLAGFMDYMP